MMDPQPLFRIWIDPELPPFDDEECPPFSTSFFYQNVVTPGIKIGFIDRSGRVVIPATFADAGDFSEGLAPASIDDRYGYISTSGQWVIEPRFQHHTSGFHEGLADAAEDEDYGYIDTTGQYVIPPKYYLAEAFCDGHAIVCIDDPARPRHCNYGVISRSGDVLIPLVYGSICDFSSGLFWVKEDGYSGHIWYASEEEPVEPRGPCGIIDLQNRFVVPYGGFKSAQPFPEGLAALKSGRKYGTIDSTGTVYILCEFDGVEIPSGGHAAVSEDGQSGYIDKTGVFVTLPKPESAESCSDGCAHVVEDRDNQRGVLDHSGEIVPPFEQMSGFRDGLALVKDDNTYGYIDKAGRFVWRGWIVPMRWP